MKKLLVLIFILAGIITAIIYVSRPNASIFKETQTAKIENKTFNLAIVTTEKEKQIGLSTQKSINNNQAMLFLFDTPSYYSFWMKDMKFPIDILFINKDKIVDIYTNLKPFKENETPIIVTPKESSDKVLEIKAGLSEKYNFKKGSKVEIKK